MTPLHYAVSCDNVMLAKLLLSRGASAEIKDNENESALEAATQSPQMLLLFNENCSKNL